MALQYSLQKQYLHTLYSSNHFFLGIIALVILQVYLAIVKHSAKAIFGLIFTLLGIAILFYAIRDAGKNEDEDDDEEVNEVTDPDIQ